LFFVRRESTWITRRQVAPELLERLVGALGVLRGHPLRAAHLLERSEQLVAVDEIQRQQQVLGRDVLVLELAHLLLGAIEHLRERGRGVRLLGGAFQARPSGEPCLGLGAKRPDLVTGTLAERAGKLLVEEREHEVLGVDLRVAAPARELARGRHGLLRLDGQLPEIHGLLLRAGGDGRS
jgi:hypothetical protein